MTTNSSNQWCRPLFSLAGVSAVLSGLCSNASLRADERKPSQFTLKQIYEGARSARQPLSNLRVEYVVTTRPLGARPPRIDGKAEAVIGTCRRTFAFKGERRYSAQAWDRGSGFLTEPTYIFDGEHGFFCRTGSVMISDGKDPSTDRGEFYCNEMVDLPVSDELRANYDNSWYYPHCLRGGRNDIVVLANQEYIDGAWCHVVKCADVQKLWVDPQIGFALRRKELYQRRAPGAADENLLHLADYSFSEFTEPVKGIWLPTLCERLTYPSEGASQKPDLEMRVEVKSLIVNQVTDSDFDLELPPGTMVLGKTIGFVTRGDKTKLLDVIAGDLSRKSEERKSSVPVQFIVISLLVAAMLALGIHWQLRSRRTRQHVG